MISFIGEEKAFDKIQKDFMREILLEHFLYNLE